LGAAVLGGGVAVATVRPLAPNERKPFDDR
jgi:hypothetical protein